MAKENSISQQAILFGIIGFLLGLVLVLFFARSAVNNNNTDMMRMMGIRQNPQMHQIMEEKEETMMGHDDESMTMDEMSESLRGKTGDDFDKSFIDEMIDHHQGAIDMANIAKISAKHQEIKNLAEDIISAQTKEIEMMQDWQKAWGY